MRCLVVVALMIGSLPAAPVPVVKKHQWALAIDGHLFLYAEGDDKPVKLTDGKGVYNHPAWSPDGMRIAFRSRRDGYDQIYVMDADGKNVVQLTHGKLPSDGPNWSPDGRIIAFSRSVAPKEPDQICTIDAADGTGLVVLSSSDDFAPVFSPNGKTIAFVTGREKEYMLYTMAADGQDAARLVDRAVFSPATPAAWSPDGERLAVTLSDEEGNELYLVRPDGSELTPLTKFGKGKMARCPSWSPDGKRLSFVLEDDTEGAKSPYSLWVMDADGGNQKELLKLDNTDGLFHPSALWRPR